MNDMQKIELEILSEIDRICQQHNLKYSLDAGTLLGAVRHKGFIPWDDDIDIIMPVKDYKKFLKICKKELDNKFFLQTAYTDNTDSLYTKIRKNDTAAVEDWALELNIHHGIWVDIFPTVGYKGKTFLKISKTCAIIRDWFLGDLSFKQNKADKNSKIYHITKFISLLPRKIRNVIAHFLDLFIYTNVGRSNTYYNVWCLDANLGTKRLYEKSLFNGYTTLEFEGYKFSCLKNYDAYLKKMYGNYMELPPVEKRKSGHNIVILNTNKNYSPNNQ